VRCAAARASRREWICGLLWWCEGRVAGAGGAGRPWGASTGQSHMAQLRIGAARVCVRAGTYAQFSRGVRGEGHEGRRPRVYWRVGVRGARRRRGPKAGRSLPSLATTRLQRNLCLSTHSLTHTRTCTVVDSLVCLEVSLGVRACDARLPRAKSCLDHPHSSTCTCTIQCHISLSAAADAGLVREGQAVSGGSSCRPCIATPIPRRLR